MQVELIEGMIANKLELSGMKNEGAEGQCRSLLYHLFTAVEIYRLMIPQEKQTATEWYNFFAKDFRVNLFLKELKSKKNKEKTAPAPHRKEKNKKEKVQKTTHTNARAKQDLEERKQAFWKELLKYEGNGNEEAQILAQRQPSVATLDFQEFSQFYAQAGTFNHRGDWRTL